MTEFDRTRRVHLLPRLLLALLATTVPALAAAAPAAALGGGTPVVVDDFTTNQSALTLTFPPAGTTASSSISGGGVIGGERDMQVSLTAGVIAGNTMSAVVSSGFFSYSQDATIAGSSHLTWDGADGSPTLAPTGLGTVDLTAAGTQDAFDLNLVFDDLPLNATLTVTSTTGASSATIALPGLVFSAVHFVVPFSAFTTTSGTGADFASAGAIELDAGSTSSAPDLVVDSLTTDALLSAPMTAALTNDVNANTLADPGDTVTYTTSISNPDDSYDASSSGTTFALTPDPDSALDPGSVTTTQGTVATGNTAGDTSVAVNAGTIADGATVTITAAVIVGTNPTSPLSAQGTVTSSALTALRTDDPGVPGPADPTETPVVENGAPSATDDAYAVVGGTTLTVPAATGVLANDSDPNADSLTAVSPVGPAHGTLTLHADGSFTYAPAAGFTGADTFTYRASDGFAQSAPATVTITVGAPPPPPPPPPPVAPPPPPPVSPLPPPGPVCARRPTLVDVQRTGRRVTVTGIAPASAAGHQVAVQALLGFAPLGASVPATVGPRGLFSAVLPLPAPGQRSQVRYRAALDGLRSRTLRLVRKIEIVSRTPTSSGTRITGRVTQAGRRTVTFTRESACNGSTVTGTARTTRSGRFTALLARPRAGDVAFYRARAVIGGSRTYSVLVGVAG